MLKPFHLWLLIPPLKTFSSLRKCWWHCQCIALTLGHPGPHTQSLCTTPWGSPPPWVGSGSPEIAGPTTGSGQGPRTAQLSPGWTSKVFPRWVRELMSSWRQTFVQCSLSSSLNSFCHTAFKWSCKIHWYLPKDKHHPWFSFLCSFCCFTAEVIFNSYTEWFLCMALVCPCELLNKAEVLAVMGPLARAGKIMFFSRIHIGVWCLSDVTHHLQMQETFDIARRSVNVSHCHHFPQSEINTTMLLVWRKRWEGSQTWHKWTVFFPVSEFSQMPLNRHKTHLYAYEWIYLKLFFFSL